MSENFDNLWPFLPSKFNLKIKKAKGSYLYLSDGRKILDASGGGGVVNSGYGRQEIVNIVAKSLRNISYALPGFQTEERLALAMNLRNNWLPPELNRMLLLNSGSDAIEAAIRIARKYQLSSGHPKRWKIIGRNLSFHGMTLGSLAIGQHHERQSGLSHLLKRQPHIEACYCARCPFHLNNQSCNIECAQHLETVIKLEGEGTIAAFLAEPIVSMSGGAIVPPKGYWPTIRNICSKYNILLILDEIATGFGRTGTRFASEHWNIDADIVVSGKGLSGGYAPLSAVFTSEKVADSIFRNRMKIVTHSYGGYPGACAAANANLNILINENLIHRAEKSGIYLSNLLNEKFKDSPNIAEIRGIGLLWAIELVKNRVTLKRFPKKLDITKRVIANSIERGVLFYPGGTGQERDIIVLCPPFIIEKQELEEIVIVLKESVDQIIS